MFDLEPGDDLTLLQDNVRRFATDVLAQRYREFEDAHGVPAEVCRRFAELGLAGLEWPERLGGAALGAVAKTLVLEELGAGDPGAALALDGLGAAFYPLLELGGAAAIERYLGPLLGNPVARATLVWDDGPGGIARPDRNGLQRSGDAYSGLVQWAPAESAELVVILDRAGASVVTSGFHFDKVKGSGLRAAGAAQITFDNAPIAARWDDQAAAARALARWRIYTSALLIGVLRVAADTSRQYATERIAFGKPIAHHQAIAFLIADMLSAVDGPRLLVQDAAWRADADLPFVDAAAAAFVETAEAAMFVTPNALQIFGGQGFMQDLPLEKFMREARTLGLMAGGVDVARDDSAVAICTASTPFELTTLMAQA